MTELETWEQARIQKNNNYKPVEKCVSINALYVVVSDTYHKHFYKGDRLKLTTPDNTSMPGFTNQNGVTSYCYWYRLKPFMLGGDK